MKKLSEVNQKSIDVSYANFPYGPPVKNGIACDKCEEELLDTNPNLILTSYPPQKNVHCEGCGFRGYRYA
jgi:hypothetical protein